MKINIDVAVVRSHKHNAKRVLRATGRCWTGYKFPVPKTICKRSRPRRLTRGRRRDGYHRYQIVILLLVFMVFNTVEWSASSITRTSDTHLRHNNHCCVRVHYEQIQCVYITWYIIVWYITHSKLLCDRIIIYVWLFGIVNRPNSCMKHRKRLINHSKYEFSSFDNMRRSVCSRSTYVL